MIVWLFVCQSVTLASWSFKVYLLSGSDLPAVFFELFLKLSLELLYFIGQAELKILHLVYYWPPMFQDHYMEVWRARASWGAPRPPPPPICPLTRWSPPLPPPPSPCTRPPPHNSPWRFPHQRQNLALPSNTFKMQSIDQTFKKLKTNSESQWNMTRQIDI